MAKFNNEYMAIVQNLRIMGDSMVLLNPQIEISINLMSQLKEYEDEQLPLKKELSENYQNIVEN